MVGIPDKITKELSFKGYEHISTWEASQQTNGIWGQNSWDLKHLKFTVMKIYVNIDKDFVR